MFSFLGSTVSDKVHGPWVNGLALAIWIYAAANISGGHLNPAVTISTLLCGFYPVLHSVLYVALQVGAWSCMRQLALYSMQQAHGCAVLMRAIPLSKPSPVPPLCAD